MSTNATATKSVKSTKVAKAAKPAAPAKPVVKAPTAAEVLQRSASTSTNKVGKNVNLTPTGLSVVIKSKEKVAAPDLLVAAYGGTVTFAKVRSTGTSRAWPVLAPETTGRAKAQEWADAYGKCVSVVAIAKAANVSVPTVRRMLTALSFTKALEAQSKTALANLAKTASAAFAAKVGTKDEGKVIVMEATAEDASA